MSLITRSEIETLIAPHEAPCITLTMPTHRKGPDVLENPIRLKNLLDRAEERLVGAGQRAPEVRTLLEPARTVERNGFWQPVGRAASLALPDCAPIGCPPAGGPRVACGFYIKPLLPSWPATSVFLSWPSARRHPPVPGHPLYVRPFLRDIPRSLEALLSGGPAVLHWHASRRRGLRRHARQEATGHEGIFHGVGYGSARQGRNCATHQIDEG